MKKTFFTFFTFLMLAFLFVACSSSTEKEQANKTEMVELTVSAAISLTDALEDIKEIYEKDNNVSITFNLAGSGTLAQQIQQGAPTDLFISANEEWMDKLDDESLMVADSREQLVKNRLVIVAGEDSDFAFDSLSDLPTDKINTVAVGNPETVPAGTYTKEALENSDLWEEIEEKIVFAKDVRQVLTYAESDNADIGFVYESDAKQSDKSKIITTIDEDLHEPITYPMMIVEDSKHQEETKAFADFLLTDEASDIFKAYGFSN